MNKDVTLILLTHKSKKLVINYLKNVYSKVKILIIDNSNDTDLENLINKDYPLAKIYLIENNGYGNAINFGSKLVDTEYFLISNPDVEGINLESLTTFVNAAKKLEDRFSVLGPRYLNANSKSLKQSLDNNSIAEMKFLSGACMFFSKKNFDKLNGFDENIFLYFEENDFCMRSHKINKNYQINNIKVKHYVGNSVETKSEEEKSKQKNLRTWHFIWSKFYYFKKHYGFYIALIYFIPIIIRINYRIFLYTIVRDKIKLEKYQVRRSGLFSSILNKKSFKRI